MCTRIESQLGEIGESAFCPVILVKQGNAVLSRPHPGRESHQLAWPRPCVGEVSTSGPWDPCRSTLTKIGDPKRHAGGRPQPGLAIAPCGGRPARGRCDEAPRPWEDPLCARYSHLSLGNIPARRCWRTVLQRLRDGQVTHLDSSPGIKRVSGLPQISTPFPGIHHNISPVTFPQFIPH